MSLTYKDAGVDKESGYKQVQLIKNLVKNSYTGSTIGHRKLSVYLN